MIRLSEYHKCENRGCVSIFSFQSFYAKFAIFIHQLKPTLFLIFRHFIKFFNLSDLTELVRARPRHSPPSRFRIEISLCNTWILLSDWLEISRPISRTLTAYLFYIRKIPTIKGSSQILAVRVLDITHITYLVWHCSKLYTAFIHGNNILL